MNARPRGLGNVNGFRVAIGLAAAALVAGTAYAVPASAAGGRAAPAPAANNHLSPRLAALADAAAGRSVPLTGPQLRSPASGAGTILRTPDGSRVVVDLRLSSRSSATMDALQAAGARIMDDDPSYGRVTVSVRPQDLDAVGDVPGVLYAGEELTPMLSATCDTTISEGDGILHADQLRATGVTGAGVKVGVLSDSYNKKSGAATTAPQDITSDNLPGATNTCGHTTTSQVADAAGSGTDEGRAMMQIVHDLAPGAAIDFATAFGSEAGFASNIKALANQGAQVIVDDVTYFDEPMYQDGIVEQAVSTVRAQGVDYFSSAANNRMVKNGHEVGSYEAVNGYRPTTCPAQITGHADCHNFGTAGSPDATFSFQYASGQTLRPILHWAEAWDGGVHTDLDLFLLDETTGTLIGTGGSVADNITSQQSWEGFAGSLNTNDTLAFVIARKSAAAPAATPRFKLLFAENGAQPFTTLEHETPAAGTGDVMGQTTFGHNGGADAMSVGASDVRVATNLNSYSSYGPVTTIFGPVNGSTPAATLPNPKVVAKPDIVASDCNKNTFFGGTAPNFHFCGTSAAAPHAAAVAALLKSKYPSATASAINSALESSAAPIAGVPASFQGAGLINALAASNKLAPPAAPTVTGTSPASPNASTTPKVVGTAAAGTAVAIFTNATCTGSPAATGTAAAFASPGIGVTVAAGSTTTFHARASNVNGASPCSSTSATYKQQSPPPAAPTVTGTSPASPNSSLTPKVVGTAAAGTTVSIFSNATCAGSPAATGTAAAFASPGIGVTVAAGSTTTFHAKASNANGSSPCSTTSATYTQSSTPPAAPTVTGTSPASPNASTTPRVVGTAAAGSTVSLFTNATCTGSPVATGTAAAFASPGIAVTVAAGSTTTFHAKASNANGSSPCSSTSATYTQQNPPPPPPVVPDTILTGTPPATVKTKHHKATVSFTFSSTVAGSTFACSIDGGAFTACSSGVSYKLKVGSHHFTVRATAAGQTDPTPAAYDFKIKHKHKRHHRPGHH